MQTLDKIRRLRKSLDLKQADMAKRLFIDQSTYSKIESGKINLLEEMKLKILEVFGMSLEAFERWEGTYDLHFSDQKDSGTDQILSPPRKIKGVTLIEKKCANSFSINELAHFFLPENHPQKAYFRVMDGQRMSPK